MHSNCGTISRLLEKYNEQNNNTLKSNPTFLEVIGRSHDEDLISRVLAYVLLTDAKCFESIAKFYFNRNVMQCKIISVECEKSMCGGRADIFVLAEDQVGNTYTLTIENKIFTWEHDDQTKTYFRFVKNQSEYKNSNNIFIYLKPDFNASEPVCKEFKTLTYGQLLDFIENTENPIICDFKRHISGYLKNNEVKMMDIDIDVFKNFKELRDIMSVAEKKFVSFKRELADVIFKNYLIPELNYDLFDKNVTSNLDKIPDGTLVVENDGGDSFRIYRNGRWYRDDSDPLKKYYFYVELKFEDNAPNKIFVQQTIKRYGGSNNENSIVTKFVNNELTNFSDYSGQWEGKWYAICKEQFYCEEYEMFTPEWKSALKTFAIKKLTEYIKEMDDIFLKFEEKMCLIQ